MKKLFMVTLPASITSFYYACSSLEEVVRDYPNAKRIELIADKVLINSGDRYNLLNECLMFISQGANTFTNVERIELVDKIKAHLK